MKKIGIIGGVGPESTIEYYRLILKRFKEKFNTEDNPEIIIHSINMKQMLNLVFNNRLDELADFLAERVKVLENAGVDYGAMASNTPHIVFESLAQKVSIPLISIVEETCKAISKKNINRVALLGTKSTMTAGFYNQVAEKYGIEVIIPESDDRDFVHDKYLNELVFNKIVPETKIRFIETVNKLTTKASLQGLILGGTELPLMLKQSDFTGIEVFDTTRIHVESILEKIMEN